MKCEFKTTVGIFADGAQCGEEATWNKKCPAHGGSVPPVSDLMKLLAKITGWGDQSLQVRIGHKRARIWIAQDESELSNNDWGYTAGTSVCGFDISIESQGETLELALFNLATAIVAKQIENVRIRTIDASSAKTKLDEFLNPPAKSTQPYR